MPRLTQAQLGDLNKTFEQRTPQELLAWARETFGDRVAAISAMQRSGSVVCRMISQMDQPMPVLFVDTGVMFPETLWTRDQMAERYGIEIRTLAARQSMEEQCIEHGVLYLTPEGQEECCHRRKVEPLRAVRGDYDALVSSLRRTDGGRRAQTPILSLDVEMNAVRINPMANFNDEQMDRFIADNAVVVNPLHRQGYTTISCNRCTTPVLPSEPKRAGRWRHLGPWSQYCGINPTDMLSDTDIAIDLDQDLIDRILGRLTDFTI